jgi:hypothetical protein
MRFSSLAPLLVLSSVLPAFAAPPIHAKDRLDAPEPALAIPRADTKGPASPANDPVVAGKTNDAPITDGGNSETGTTFNGHRVPPLTELSGETIDPTISKGYWYADMLPNQHSV